MPRCAAIPFVLISLILMEAPSALADWLNLTGAQSAPNIGEIYVEEDHVRIVLELHVNDLDKFIHVIPEEWVRQAGAEPPPLKERMRRFSSETLQIITDDRTLLRAQLKLAELRMRTDRPNPFAGAINPTTGRPVPGPPEDKRVLYVELTYPFKGQPQSLTIVPPLDNKGIATAAIGFIAYHKQVPVVDYRYLTRQARLELDWEDPWYSRFEKRALKRWQQSGLRTFLYVEPLEVRHETLVRVKDLEAWMDLELRGDKYIEVDEFAPLKERVGEFMLNHSSVIIDGERLRPILDRTAFVKYTMTRTFFIEQPERMLINTAMVGVIVTYLTSEIPQQVTVDWDLFSDRLQRIPATAVDPAGPFSSFVTPDDNVLTWTNYLKNYEAPTVAAVSIDESMTTLGIPLASVLCLLALVPVILQLWKRRQDAKSLRLHAVLALLLIAGTVLLYPYMRLGVTRPSAITPRMPDEDAVVVLNSLLGNIYRAFDFREEEDVYDRLAVSVHGELLSDIYLQNRKSLVVTQAGGAQARVKEVEILEADRSQDDGDPLKMVYRASWTAMGSVGHWGHIHIRKNQYEANIVVEAVEGSWKITDLELLEEERIDPYGNPPGS
jgi:hypothetical protein